jgi:signal-transduction protein with cAMP-binding, CBS, and nucleotidyltransferase domain
MKLSTQTMKNRLLAELPPEDLADLIGHLNPINLPKKQILYEVGAPGLIYLASGEAEVTLRGRPIAQCTSGSFIGEMSCFDGSPANATVSLRQPSRYFLIRSEALNRLGARDLDMRRTVENGVGNDTRHKLIETDLRLREAAGA